MQDSDFQAYEFEEKDFIKDYRKTAEILEEMTRNSLKHTKYNEGSKSTPFETAK